MIDWGPGGRRSFDHRSAGWPLVGKHATSPVRDLPRQPPHRHAGHRAPARSQPEAHDLPRAAIAVRQLSLRRAPRPAGSGLPALPQRRGPDLRGRPIVRSRPHRLSAARETQAAGLRRLPPAGRRWGRSDRVSQAAGGGRSPGTSRSRTAAARAATAIRTAGPSGTAAPTATTKTAGTSSSPSQGLGENFHDATRFPLKGLHRDVKCKSCHGPFGSRPVQYKGLAFRKCGDCHPDGHEGQLAARAGAAPADCGDCHSVSGFSPARFELEQHAKTPFPLTGAHRATACRSCHLVDAELAKRVDPAVRAKLARQRRPERIALVMMRPKRAPGDCSDCHRDPHQGQFAAQTMAGDDCAACHTTESFAKIRFDHNRDSRFPLTGAHSKAPCAELPQTRGHPRRRPGGDPLQTGRDVLYGLSPR